jgi:hypothetical protein
MLNFSDDYGVIEFDPPELKARIYPYAKEDHNSVIVPQLFGELLPKRIVSLFGYSPDDDTPFKPFLFIRNFSKHQKVEKPGKPLIPEWNKKSTPENFSKDHTAFPEGSPKDHRTLGEYSATIRGGNRKGKEVEGKGKEKDLKDLPQPVDNFPSPATGGADDGGNAEGHPPVAPTLSVDPEVVKLGEIIKRRQAEGIPH